MWVLYRLLRSGFAALLERVMFPPTEIMWALSGTPMEEWPSDDDNEPEPEQEFLNVWGMRVPVVRDDTGRPIATGPPVPGVTVKPGGIKPHFCVPCQIKHEHESICFNCGQPMVEWHYTHGGNMLNPSPGASVAELISGDPEDARIGDDYVHPPMENGGQVLGPETVV